MLPIALVTGAGGFLGRHLCPLLTEGYQVLGADLAGVEPPRGVRWETVEEDRGLADLVREIRPGVVVHAAFVNRKPPEWTDLRYLEETLTENVALFETLTEVKGKLLLVSSSAVYGNGQGRERIDETCPRRPISLYGLAKTIQEAAAQFHGALGLEVEIARLFNLSGPGQKPGMLLPD